MMAEQELVPTPPDSLADTDLQGTFPSILVRAGRTACFAADEFFSARISNPHTRTAYARQVSRFLTWCDDQGLELRQITLGLAGRFLDELPGSAPTQNQALAALRHFFDVLVARHAAVLNPFQSVRGVRHQHGEGRTPEATVEQARQLLASIQTDSVYGLRDRAVLGTLIYTGARVGAISPAPDAGPARSRQPPVAAVLRRKGGSRGRSRCATTWTAVQSLAEITCRPADPEKKYMVADTTAGMTLQRMDFRSPGFPLCACCVPPPIRLPDRLDSRFRATGGSEDQP